MPNKQSFWTQLVEPSEQSRVVDCDHQYHYWFHTGEAHAIRQQLGDGELPQFVGDMSAAMYAYGFQGDG